MHHIHHVLNISEAISLVDDQPNLVVCCFDPCNAQVKSDRVQNVFLMPVDFLYSLLIE